MKSTFTTWKCPDCRRPFKHKNQAHSCVTLTPAAHLDNNDAVVRSIYDALAKAVNRFGDVTVSVTKSSIMFVSKSTFLAVKPKRRWIDIEFLLDKQVDEYPIHKTVRANKSRVAHFVRLESTSDVTPRLIRLLKASYTVTSDR